MRQNNSQNRTQNQATRPLSLVILSACRGDRTDAENRVRTGELARRLECLRRFGDITDFYPAQGVWQGEHEESFVVAYDATTQHNAAAATLVEIARGYEQECVLFVDSMRNARLVPACDPDCRRELGRFRQAFNDELVFDNYTVINGVRHICA